MTQPPPPPPPEDILNEPVKSKERQELFPDEPAGRPNQRKDEVVSVEGEQVREQNKGDENADRIRRIIKDTFTLEGRVSFRLDGDDFMMKIFSCNRCRALVARDDVEPHYRWHERTEHRQRG